jgi:hypothetical protein
MISSVPYIRLSGFNGSLDRYDLVFDGRQTKSLTNEQLAAFCESNKRPGWVRQVNTIGGFVYVLKKGCGHQIATDYSDGLFRPMRILIEQF